MDKTEYPENKACKVWEHQGAALSLVKVERSYSNHYCGYVRFPQRFVIDQGYSGLLTYVPAHGGLTYAEESKDGSMVYGFDCAHYEDDRNPNLRDEEWLSKHCEDIVGWLMAVPEHEKAYLLAESPKAKAEAVDAYIEAIGIEGVPLNLGSMINILTGQP